jgi:hypothetical protein
VSNPDWTFTGTVTHREDRTTAKGKAMQNIVLSRQGTYGPELCVCAHFGDLHPDVSVGATVNADGYMSGREYNGKHYAGLRAQRLYVQGNQSADEPPAQPTERPASRLSVPPVAAESDLPF